ncbi:hypothetical protein PRIPAC_78379 [Pristionchus pacificus]|uniref:G protein-coupled receptor n=1 Tax=Pristionchus pacificus TaxID=54126 RepID=A0A2A6BWB1_PRIPA|nr:hypothetical protein PRIPAC_78379 [Pristionchus pacificus]|eukprot:PDM70073.1 G protein-coupled receptor [Pristionchus pacificus]
MLALVPPRISLVSIFSHERAYAIHYNVNNRSSVHRTLPAGTVRDLDESSTEFIFILLLSDTVFAAHFQAVLDLFFVPYFILNANSLTWPFAYPFLLWTNGINTFYPPFSYIYVFYILYGQCYGIVLISLHRLLSVLTPQSKAIQFLDKLPRLLIFVAHLVSPLAGTSVHFFFQTPTRFVYRNETNSLQKVTNTADINVNSVIATSTTVSVTIFGFLCYSVMFVRLRKMTTRDTSRIRRRELPLIIASFSLFLFMCLMTAYFVLLYLISSVGTLADVQELRTFYPLLSALFCYSTPWLLLVTSAETRKRVLGGRLDSMLACRLGFGISPSSVIMPTQPTLATTEHRLVSIRD